jgi:acid phosphatase (class A)
MRPFKLPPRSAIALCILIGAAIDVCAADTPVPETKAPTTLLGYLQAAALPSSASLVPPPPAPGSVALARDEELNRSALKMHGSPRWDMATNDAVLAFPALAETFSCALNLPMSQERTPKTIALLRRMTIDAGRGTSEAKRLYQRTRPFVVNEKPICTPNSEAGLRLDGSYPSGHSSIGWALALVLSEVSPQQATAVLARGRAFGESRLVCNVHWQSDVQEGQMVAAAVVARLHAETDFRNDVAAARAEVDALHAGGAVAEHNCDLEAKTLKSWP